MAKKSLRRGQRRRNKNWVNVYEIDRAYGGPEEGGRWFNYGVCVESWQHRSRKRALKTLEWAKAQRRYQGSNREIWSVNHRLGDTVRIELENRQGADWDDYRPYE
jgi:hypothetical protein